MASPSESPALMPGDSVAILPWNSPQEVAALLTRLGVSLDQARAPLLLSLITGGEEGTIKKRARIPDHLISTGTGPQPMSLRQALVQCCDIRAPMSKAGCRLLAEYCTSELEKRRLLELSSRQGQQLYTACLREPQLSLLDLLIWFPTCHPPISRLLELLPRLSARPYSLAAWQSPTQATKSSTQRIQVVFNRADLPAIPTGRTYPRYGVATGYLTSGTRSRLAVYPRKNLGGFRLPEERSRPIVLIGPGTGCAPFVAMLQERQYQREMEPETEFGPVWLFHGCRHRDKDYIFQTELTAFVSSSCIQHLCLCFSRENDVKNNEKNTRLCHPGARYVQDCLRHHSNDLARLITEERAMILVCGDAHGMAKDVSAAWADVLVTGKGWTETEATTFVTQMRVQRQYLEDVWT